MICLREKPHRRFYQPDAVFTDPKFLETLSGSQFSNGMAELLKHGFIRDADLYNVLVSGDFNRNDLKHKMDELIYNSCLIKRDVVEEDEFDNGVRQVLNFGHTIGHAIERVQNYSGLSHGEAVSIGMALITEMTEKMELTRKGETEKIKLALKKYGLPVKLPSLNTNDLVKAIALDKKNRSGKITIAYIEEIGSGKLIDMNLTELEGKIHEILRIISKPLKGKVLPNPLKVWLTELLFAQLGKGESRINMWFFLMI